MATLFEVFSKVAQTPQQLARGEFTTPKVRNPAIYKPKKLKTTTKEKKPFRYWPAVGAAAPIFGIKAFAGDMPRKTVEEVVEQKSIAKRLKLPSPKVKSIAGKALTGRGLATAAAGAGIGILTAPIFIKGITTLEKAPDAATKKQRIKQIGAGLALVGASGAVYQGVKGFGEGYGVAKSRGLPTAARVGTGTSYSLGRLALKTPAALAIGAGIAMGRKKKDKGPVAQYGLPVALGAGAGGVQNTLNAMLDSTKGKKGLKKMDVLRRLPGALAGKKVAPKYNKAVAKALAGGKSGLIGGAMGGLIAAVVLDKAIKRVKAKQKLGSPQFQLLGVL
jgi:hypothetical protein